MSIYGGTGPILTPLSDMHISSNAISCAVLTCLSGYVYPHNIQPTTITEKLSRNVRKLVHMSNTNTIDQYNKNVYRSGQCNALLSK